MTKSAVAPLPEADLGELLSGLQPEMFRWAKHLTKGDSAQAEDLVQDISLKFLSSPRRIDGVRNLKGFIRTSMQNAFISQKRNSQSHSELPLPQEFEYSSLLTSDPRSEWAAGEMLIDILHFACLRRTRTLSASVLLLRCFHGYRIQEISRILKRPRNSVEALLLAARREVAGSVMRAAMSHYKSTSADHKFSKKVSDDSDDPVISLRKLIFTHRSGECSSEEELLANFLDPLWIPDRREIAHIVVCRRCIEKVNRILALPSLEDRHPLDLF